MDFRNFTIKEFHDGLISRNFSATEAARHFFDLIEEGDEKIGAYLRLTKDMAFSQASVVDEEVSRGSDPGVLAGVPFAIKDNILIKGEVATSASKILSNYRASYDATVIKKLKDARAVFLGKTNLDEFAMGSSTENSGFKKTYNPYSLTHVPGGSSGGSAASVAANLALAALGSDTGGSIRQPAAFCGVVGLKPTYGAVSRFGLMAMASSLDQIGPITKTVEDAAIVFDAISGFDKFDSTSVVSDYDNVLEDDGSRIKGLTIGLPKEYFIDGLDSAVQEGVQIAIDNFKKLGFKIKEISLPHTKYALSCYYIIMPAEVSTNLARYDGIRYARENSKFEIRNSKLIDIYLKQRGEGFGREVRGRVLLGTFVLSSGYYDAYYTKAQKVRRLIKEDFDNAFDASVLGVDVILTPVTPTPAFKIGEKTDDPLKMYLSDIFTIPVNLAGLPALSLPVEKYEIPRGPSAGSGQSALPIGFQLIGKRFHEADILGMGQIYEKFIG